jgi:WD40 repeat protein
MFSAHTISYRD